MNNIADQLEKLQNLHKNGSLDENEFAAAKKKILTKKNTPHKNHLSFGGASNRYVDLKTKEFNFEVIWAVVGIILMLLFFFGFFLPQWNGMHNDFNKRRNFLSDPLPPGFFDK